MSVEWIILSRPVVAQRSCSSDRWKLEPCGQRLSLTLAFFTGVTSTAFLTVVFLAFALAAFCARFIKPSAGQLCSLRSHGLVHERAASGGAPRALRAAPHPAALRGLPSLCDDQDELQNSDELLGHCSQSPTRIIAVGVMPGVLSNEQRERMALHRSEALERRQRMELTRRSTHEPPPAAVRASATCVYWVLSTGARRGRLTRRLGGVGSRGRTKELAVARPSNMRRLTPQLRRSRTLLPTTTAPTLPARRARSPPLTWAQRPPLATRCCPHPHPPLQPATPLRRCRSGLPPPPPLHRPRLHALLAAARSATRACCCRASTASARSSAATTSSVGTLTRAGSCTRSCARSGTSPAAATPHRARPSTPASRRCRCCCTPPRPRRSSCRWTRVSWTLAPRTHCARAWRPWCGSWPRAASTCCRRRPSTAKGGVEVRPCPHIHALLSNGPRRGCGTPGALQASLRLAAGRIAQRRG